MPYGRKENPALSPTAHLEGIDYPVTREALVQTAADNGGSVDVINIFKSMPREDYQSRDEIFRDYAEAARRFGMSNFAGDDDGVIRDRRNIGRDAVEKSHIADSSTHVDE